MNRSGKESKTDPIVRSLLQKAVRRGDTRITEKALNRILLDQDFPWARNRLGVITFEECWTYGSQVSFENDPQVICAHYLRLAKTVKNKDAAGLGSLAYALSQNDVSVLEANDNKAVRMVAEAIRRPNDFWNWILEVDIDDSIAFSINSAWAGFKRAGWPWDRAFTIAAAYLALAAPAQNALSETEPKVDFPLWVSIDKHTSEGKIAIRTAANETKIDVETALYLSFYFESAHCLNLERSVWWEREVVWRLGKLNLTVEEGRSLWNELRPIVRELLAKDEERLRERIFSAENYCLEKTQPRMF